MTTTACLALMQPSCIKLQPLPKWLQAIGGQELMQAVVAMGGFALSKRFALSKGQD